MRWLLIVLAFLALPLFAAEVQEDPIERQMLDIAKDLRCAVCQNQPVSESHADLARDMRGLIREQLEAGKSRDEIVDYFVDRYGDYVLMKPPADSLGVWVWVAPPVLLLVVGGFAVLYVRRRLRAAPAGYPTLSAEDRARVQAAREEQES